MRKLWRSKIWRKYYCEIIKTNQKIKTNRQHLFVAGKLTAKEQQIMNSISRRTAHRRWKRSSWLWVRRCVPFFSHFFCCLCVLLWQWVMRCFPLFSCWMFLLSHCQFQKWLSNLLDFFNPPSVYVKHVCFVNFTQWVAQQLQKLAFQLPTQLSFGSTASFSVSVSLPYYCWSKKQTSRKLLFLEPS